MATLWAAALPADAATVISTPTAIWNPVHSFIILIPTSRKRRCWSVSGRRFSWPITTVSPSTTIICARVRCSKTRSFCPKWWQNPARIRPTWRHRKARSTFAKSAGHMPSAGSPQQSLSGRRTIRNGCNSYKPPHHFSLPDEKPPLLRSLFIRQ